MSRFAFRGLALVASLLLAGAAIAAPKPFTHATGGIGLSGPLQYVAFNAFDYGATGDRGTVSYANFEYAAPGTGVWNVAGTYPLVTALGGSPYPHTMTVDTIKPVSTTATKFSGSGFYDPDPSYTWTVTGMVSGSDISFTLVYTGTGAGYTFSATGTIAADGSASGTATDSALQSPLTWSIPAGSMMEVLSYTASVSCAVVGAVDATFVFTIPPGFPGLSGLAIVAKVHDGGTPGTDGDTWGHGLATSLCDGSVVDYPIVSGNLVVH
jgi:hypothetical protein